MSRPRRLADIRARASGENELLRARAALRQPWASASHGWHEAFLDAVVQGATISAAAASSGVSRNAVYWARENVQGFEHALRLMLAARGLTMQRNRRTQFRANVACSLSIGTGQNAVADGRREIGAKKTRHLFPLVEKTAIFGGLNPPHSEAACP